MDAETKRGCCKPSFVGCRHIVALLGFLSCFFINIQRLSLGVAIVAMVNHSSIKNSSKLNSSLMVCPPMNKTESSWKQRDLGEFFWSSEEQGYVLGAGFLGFCLATVPGSKLARTFQARRVLLYSIIVMSFATFISPLAARLHIFAMIVAQFLRGVGQACLFVSLFGLMANWFPRRERGLLSTFVISGFSIGATVAAAVTGLICDVPELGWPGVFYIVGGYGIIHALLTVVLLYETPQDHPRISVDELTYLIDNLESSKTLKKPSTPWLKIFTSVPFYALLVALIGQYWTFSYFWTVHSTFLGVVQNFPIDKNGYWSCLPFLMKAFGEYLTSSIANWLLVKDYVTVDAVRRGCNTLGCIGFSASVIGTYFSDCNGALSAATAAISMFFVGVATPGAMITCMDMAPRFAGSLSGVLNGVGYTTSFIVPILVGVLTKNKTLEEYHRVFIISIAVVMTSGIVFAIFGSGNLQTWNSIEENKKKDMDLSEKKKMEIASITISVSEKPLTT